MAYTPTVWLEGITDVGPTNLNHLETGVQSAAATADAAIPAPIGPAASAGLVWNGSSWVAAKIVNANVDAAAAIAYSKLQLAGSVVNNDIAVGAAIAPSKIGATYTAYTPTWASSGTAVALGNGTVAGHYVQIGKFVHFMMQFTAGTTTTFGTGTYTFTLPVAANATFQGTPIGSVYAEDVSASSFSMALPILATGAAFNIQYTATWPTGTQTGYGQLTPWTWATGDIIWASGTYEAA